MSSSSPHPPEADAPSAPVVDQPRNDNPCPKTPPPGLKPIDPKPTPVRPGVQSKTITPGLPQENELRQDHVDAATMDFRIHQISVEDMFKDYLNCGGEPGDTDYAEFYYHLDVPEEEREKDWVDITAKNVREPQLIPILCKMGQSVADRADNPENPVIFRDISSARNTDHFEISEKKESSQKGQQSSATGSKASTTASKPSAGSKHAKGRGRGPQAGSRPSKVRAGSRPSNAGSKLSATGRKPSRAGNKSSLNEHQLPSKGKKRTSKDIEEEFEDVESGGEDVVQESEDVGQKSGDGTTLGQGTTSRTHGTTPDVGVYLDNERTKELLIEPKASKKTKEQNDVQQPEDVKQPENWAARRSYSDLVSFFEAKTKHSECAFEFLNPSSNLIHRGLTIGGHRGLGQFLEYNAQVLGHQHRTHLFSTYVYKDQARIAYADRSGVVVSEPFKYGKRLPEQQPLYRFLWKVARMTDKERGYDDTAKLATEDDLKALREYAATLPTDYLKGQAYHALSWNPNAKVGEELTSFEWPVYKLTMADNDEEHEEHEEEKKKKKEWTIFAGRPSFTTASLFGRCTRAYPVFEEVGEKDGKRTFELRFFKDSWRVQHADGRIHPEHEVYKRLERNGVTGHVLTYLAGGDVLEDGVPQRTKLHAMNPERPLHPRVHYRILLKEVCRPLTDFEDFRELSAILRDALQGHKDAWEKARVLHRDVSFNNILIYEFKDEHGVIVRKGILSDWDLSKYKEDMETGTGPREPDHTGTWHFRSAVLGRYPTKPYELSDDIESFVHVYHYSVLRFHDTTVTYELETTFNHHFGAHAIRPADGAHLGGQQKFSDMCSTGPFIYPTENISLDYALQNLATICSEHYSTINKKDYDDKYNPKVAATPAGAEDHAQALARRPVRRPKRASTPQDRTLGDHEELLSFFTDTSDPTVWRAIDLKKDKDLFKKVGLTSGKNNYFSSRNSSRDVEPMTKKHKVAAGTGLGPLAETPEPSAAQGEEMAVDGCSS